MDITEEDRVNFTLAFLSNFGSCQVGSRLEYRFHDLIKLGLWAMRSSIGEWEVVWGPAVLQLYHGEGPAENAMFVARSRGAPSRYVVSISGTNPFSIMDWFVEASVFSHQVPWPTVTSFPRSPKIAVGVGIGLVAIQNLKPSERLPGAGTTLLEFLTGLVKGPGSDPIDILLTGHSLGGTLSSTAALWLRDSQGTPSGWDPAARATIRAMPVAGLTAGNKAFSDYSDTRIARADMRRFANRLDVIPHAWNTTTMVGVKELYSPKIGRSLLVDYLASSAVKSVKGVDEYVHVNPDSLLLPGDVDEDLIEWWLLPSVNYIIQMLYQHVWTYARFFSFGSQESWLEEQMKKEFSRVKAYAAMVKTNLKSPRELWERTIGIGHRKIPIAGGQHLEVPRSADHPGLPGVLEHLGARLERSLSREDA